MNIKTCCSCIEEAAVNGQSIINVLKSVKDEMSTYLNLNELLQFLIMLTEDEQKSLLIASLCPNLFINKLLNYLSNKNDED